MYRVVSLYCRFCIESWPNKPPSNVGFLHDRSFPVPMRARPGGGGDGYLSVEMVTVKYRPALQLLAVVHPTPYTLHLHPTPYTLHSTLYTLHTTPYTLHPTTHTLHPTPSTLQKPSSVSLFGLTNLMSSGSFPLPS